MPEFSSSINFNSLVKGSLIVALVFLVSVVESS